MTLEALESVASNPAQQPSQGWSGRSAQPHSQPGQPLSEEASGDDVAAIRRQLRIDLLRDLVSSGLYRVSTDVLAERLMAVVVTPF